MTPSPALYALLLLLALAAPQPALARQTEPALQAARAQAGEARTQLASVRSRQAALRSELNTLAARIEQLKAQRQGKLSAGEELETALRRSQELSAELTQLAQALAAAESLHRSRASALHAALSAELLRLRAAWEATPEREARARLLERMRLLRTERDGVRAALPDGELPALATTEGAAADGASDDPEDLLEQADALRDSRDKVRQRLAALQGHIAELREARDLERRMSDFLGDESMFDEQDRRMRLRRVGDASLRVDRTPPSGRAGGDFADPAPAAPEDSPATPAPPAAAPPNFESPPPSAQPTTGVGAPPVASASDVRPQLGTGGVRSHALAGGQVEDLPTLEREAARLEQLARELEARAAALEARGRSR